MALVMVMSFVKQKTRRVCNLPCPADATCLGLQKQSARLLLEQMCDWLLDPIYDRSKGGLFSNLTSFTLATDTI